MDKICPGCDGNKVIPVDNGIEIIRYDDCQTCKGKSRIPEDRDTEEIIEELENCFLGHDEYILGLLAELKKRLKMDKIREELNSCPCCGSEAILQETEGGDYVISCTECSLTICDEMLWDLDNYDGKQNVIDNWNKRSRDEEIKKLKHDLGDKKASSKHWECITKRLEIKLEQRNSKIKKLRDVLEISEKWISVKDKMPERSECGKYYLCVIQGYNDPWIEITYLYDPLEPEFEAEKKDEKPYFPINKTTRGAVVQSESKVTHWMPLPELPKITQKSSLFEDLGTVLNPNKALKDGE